MLKFAGGEAAFVLQVLQVVVVELRMLLMHNHDDTNVTDHCPSAASPASRAVCRRLAPLSMLRDGDMGDNAVVVIVCARFRIFRALDIKHNR